MQYFDTAPDRIVTVYNPYSRHAADAGSCYLAQIHAEYGDRVIEVHTEPDFEATGRKIQDCLAEGVMTRVVAIGGDFTASASALALAETEIETRFPGTALSIIPAGGKIDMYYALAGRKSAIDPVRALHAAGALRVHPVHAVVELPGGAPARHYRAAGHLSLGVSAETAAYIGMPNMRRLRCEQWHDLRATVHTLAHARRFTRIEHGRRLPTFDDIYPVVPRMGGYVTFPQVDIEDTVLHRYTVGGRQPAAVALAGALLHWTGHEAHTSSVTYTIEGQPQGGLYIQRDGEATGVDADSTITIRREAVAFTLIHPLTAPRTAAPQA